MFVWGELSRSFQKVWRSNFHEFAQINLIKVLTSSQSTPLDLYFVRGNGNIRGHRTPLFFDLEPPLHSIWIEDNAYKAVSLCILIITFQNRSLENLKSRKRKLQIGEMWPRKLLKTLCEVVAVAWQKPCCLHPWNHLNNLGIKQITSTNTNSKKTVTEQWSRLLSSISKNLEHGLHILDKHEREYWHSPNNKRPHSKQFGKSTIRAIQIGLLNLSTPTRRNVRRG